MDHMVCASDAARAFGSASVCGPVPVGNNTVCASVSSHTPGAFCNNTDVDNFSLLVPQTGPLRQADRRCW